MGDMPGESLWVAQVLVRSTRNPMVPGGRARIVGGGHVGKFGIIRQVDGAGDMVQIRTGDPAAWAEWDAETQRMLDAMTGGV